MPLPAGDRIDGYDTTLAPREFSSYTLAYTEYADTVAGGHKAEHTYVIPEPH